MRKLVPNILAIETSTRYSSVAVSCNKEIVTYEMDPSEQNSEWVLSAIDKLLKAVSLSQKDIDVIGFGQGPGSFTGVRTAISVAQAMAFSLNIPLVPVSTLQIIAQQALRKYQCSQVLSALDARLNQVYWACFKINSMTQLMEQQGREYVDDPDNVVWPRSLSKNFKGIGSGWDNYSNRLRGEWIAGVHPNAYDAIALTNFQYQNNHQTSALAVKPVYVRDQVTRQIH